MFLSFFSVPLQSATQEELHAFAIKNNDSELIEVLMKYGYDKNWPILNNAMKSKDYFSVFMLIEYGVDINSRHSSGGGQTILEMAIEYNEISLIEYFLMNKADPTNPLKNKIIKSNSPHREENYLTTAVYKAIMLNRLDILYLFHQYGVDFNKICNEVKYIGGQWILYKPLFK